MDKIPPFQQSLLISSILTVTTWPLLFAFKSYLEFVDVKSVTINCLIMSVSFSKNHQEPIHEFHRNSIKHFIVMHYSGLNIVLKAYWAVPDIKYKNV